MHLLAHYLVKPFTEKVQAYAVSTLEQLATHPLAYALENSPYSKATTKCLLDALHALPIQLSSWPTAYSTTLQSTTLQRIQLLRYVPTYYAADLPIAALEQLASQHPPSKAHRPSPYPCMHIPVRPPSQDQSKSQWYRLSDSVRRAVS